MFGRQVVGRAHNAARARIVRILERDPDWSALSPGVPASTHRVTSPRPGPPETWTSSWYGSFTPNAWNTVALTVPPNAVGPFQNLGLQFATSAGWTNTCYIDSVSWNTPAPDFILLANPASLTVQGGTNGTSTITDAPTIRSLKFALQDEFEDWRDGEMLLQSLIDTPEKVDRAARRQADLEKLYVASGGIAGPGSLGQSLNASEEVAVG